MECQMKSQDHEFSGPRGNVSQLKVGGNLNLFRMETKQKRSSSKKARLISTTLLMALLLCTAEAATEMAPGTSRRKKAGILYSDSESEEPRKRSPPMAKVNSRTKTGRRTSTRLDPHGRFIIDEMHLMNGNEPPGKKGIKCCWRQVRHADIPEPEVMPPTYKVWEHLNYLKIIKEKVNAEEEKNRRLLQQQASSFLKSFCRARGVDPHPVFLQERNRAEFLNLHGLKEPIDLCELYDCCFPAPGMTTKSLDKCNRILDHLRRLAKAADPLESPEANGFAPSLKKHAQVTMESTNAWSFDAVQFVQGMRIMMGQKYPGKKISPRMFLHFLAHKEYKIIPKEHLRWEWHHLWKEPEPEIWK